jgi:hypothetical protein
MSWLRSAALSTFLCSLGACVVGVSGAPCTVDTNCPSEQICGADHTCQPVTSGSGGGASGGGSAAGGGAGVAGGGAGSTGGGAAGGGGVAVLTLKPVSTSDFGNVTVGQSVTQSFTLTNAGTQPSGVISLSLSATTSEFSILGGLGGDCGAQSLAGNASCTVRVQFKPLGGMSTATLGANASPGGTTALSLQANGQYVLQVTKPAVITADGTVKSDTGAISCGAACTAAYTSGTQVTMSQAPNTGSTFTGWSGACTGTGTCTFAMTQNRNVQANYALLPSFNLSVVSAGTGSGTIGFNPTGASCGTNCYTYFQGTSVTISPASLGPGSYLRSFAGACTGSSCVVVVNAATSVTANFEVLPQLWYTFDVNGNNTGLLTDLGYNMIPAGTPTYVAGKVGKAIAFSGGSTGNISGMRYALGSAALVTVAFWLNLSAVTSYGTGIAVWSADNQTDPFPYGGLRFTLTSATTASICMSSASTRFLPSGTCAAVALPATAATGWHHYLFQYLGTGVAYGQGGPMNVFIDGAATPNFSIANEPSPNPVFHDAMENNLGVGGNGVMMDDMRIYTRKFTPAEHCTAIIGGTWSGTACTLPP